MPARVAVVVKYYLPMVRISGIVSYLSLVVDELARGADVHVVTACPPGEAAGELRVGRATVHRVAGLFPARAARTVRRFRPDALLLVSGIYDLRQAAAYFAPFRALAGRRGGRRVFYQATNARDASTRALALTLRGFDAYVGASAEIVRLLERGFPGRTHLVEPGVDLARLRAVVASPRTAPHRIGFVNHLNAVKGADLAVDAMLTIAERRDDVDFVVAGTGEMDSEVDARLAGRLRVDRRGFVGDDERMALLASCDAVLLPFRTGVSVLGVSQTVLECMAVGAVVVGSRSGAIEPAIEPGVDGVLFDVPSEIVPAVERLLDEPARTEALRTAARASVERYDVRDRAADLARLLGVS